MAHYYQLDASHVHFDTRASENHGCLCLNSLHGQPECINPYLRRQVMNPSKFLIQCATLIGACAFAAPFAHAAYPDRPITFVVPYTPGGAADTLARVLAQRMS